MHVHTKRPDCYADDCAERGERWIGKGRECGNFRDAGSEHRNLRNTPSCEGCARMLLARTLDGRVFD